MPTMRLEIHLYRSLWECLKGLAIWVAKGKRSFTPLQPGTGGATTTEKNVRAL